jgi:adenine deaminase
VSSTVNVRWDAVDLRIPATGARVRVIGSLPNQLVTEARILPATVEDGNAVADPARDVLKMAVIERHKASGALGLGFIQGIGLHAGRWPAPWRTIITTWSSSAPTMRRC